MLKSLLISNYALIDRTHVDLMDGFTVITGETGAGKSILLEALALVLGSRANFNAIRKGEEKSVVEAVFSESTSEANKLLEREGLDVLTEIILRRELTASGRSRAFINDSPVGLALLKELGLMMVDMHGQQENIALQSSQYQMKQVDLFAKSQTEFQAYQEALLRQKNLQKQMDQLLDSAAQVRKDEDYFRFQYSELTEFELNVEVFQGLEEELAQLEHAEDIQKALGVVDLALEGEERSALQAIRLAISELKHVSEFSSALKELSERLISASIELEDIRSECDKMQSQIESNPNRLETVRNLLDTYNRLMHKHSVTEVEQLIEVREEYRIKLEGIASYDSELEALTEKLEEANAALKVTGNALHLKRAEAIPQFEKSLQAQVRKLGMEKAEIHMLLTTTDSYSSMGKDQVDFQFDANGNQRLVSLKESASGGEIARLMLALKSIIAANDRTPTMIFDEVDTGVSGEVAKQIGNLMNAISENAQIIAVTHLPGVAAKGKHHIKIDKLEEEGRPVSRLKWLDEELRVKEIAAMFTGRTLTDASLESARMLLNER